MDLRCTTTEVLKMTKDQIAGKIIENAHRMADQITRGKDIEIRKSPSGVVIIEIDKKVIFK
mgnify:CR=1 FL=1